MKKTLLILTLALVTTNLFAQFESNIKIGASINTSGSGFGGKLGLYLNGSFGYRFFATKRVTLIPMVFIDKSDYSIDDLTFGGMLLSNGNFTFKTSTLSYQLYGAGLNIATEIKLLNLEKKVNLYISPSLAYHRFFYVYQESSNPNLDVNKHPVFQQNIIIDWGLEIGVKLQKFKIGVSYQDVLNKGNRNNSSFVITNAFSLSASYLFGGNKTKE